MAGTVRTNLSQAHSSSTCSCVAQSLREFILPFLPVFEQHVGTDPEDADEDAHDCTVILLPSCEGPCCRIVGGIHLFSLLKSCERMSMNLAF